MICPRCNVKMTKHAAKVVYATSASEEALVDPVLGGVLLERHQCPECGEGASHRVPPELERERG